MSKTRALTNFNEIDDPVNGDRNQLVDTSSGLLEIFIASTGTINSIVSINVNSFGGTGYLIRNVVVPVGTTLRVLEGTNLRITKGKVAVILENGNISGPDINVITIGV